MSKPITSNDILRMLADKHREDVFIPECKTGPSRMSYCPRMDAWVMKKSWANPLFICYEIKVRRSDFLKDDKWKNYLEFCNEFYFVCPSKVINVNEVPADAGLMYCSSTGSVVYRKKKSPYRDVKIPDEIFRYILMARAKIVNDCEPKSNAKYWKEWLKDKSEDLSTGRIIGKRIRELIENKIRLVKSENDELKTLIDKYEDVKSVIKRLGHDPDHFSAWRLERQMEKIQEYIPEDLTHSITNLKQSLERFESEISKLKHPIS